MRLSLLKEKRVLILGLAREGESSFKFLRKKFPKKQIGLADKLSLSGLNSSIKKLTQKDSKIQTHLGKNYLNSLKDYDIILKSPGIPLKTISPYLTKNQIITSQTDIFLEKYASQTIGITGTKGKSTTASLIYNILKKAGIKTELIGNIGKPVLSFYDQEKQKMFVYELSSHQLQGLKVSPHIAVFLNFYKEHLDYYKNLREYLKAKKNITLWQKKNDFFVLNYDQKKIRNLSKLTKSQIVPISSKTILRNGCFLHNNAIYHRKELIIKVSEIPFGMHYLYNAMASIAVSKIFDIPTKIIQQSIKTFTPLEHRLEFVGKFRGIKFYNDSLATIPEATISAIDSIKDIYTLITGGYDRGQQLNRLAQRVLKSDIKTIILFPDTGENLYKLLKSHRNFFKKTRFFLVKDMKTAIKLAYKHTAKNKTCLLSPAAASFNLFKDYRHRGNLFKKYIKEISRNEKEKG